MGYIVGSCICFLVFKRAAIERPRDPKYFHPRSYTVFFKKVFCKITLTVEGFEEKIIKPVLILRGEKKPTNKELPHAGVVSFSKSFESKHLSIIMSLFKCYSKINFPLARILYTVIHRRYLQIGL